MSFSDAVVPGEAIESDNESEVEFNINNTLQKVKCNEFDSFSSPNS